MEKFELQIDSQLLSREWTQGDLKRIYLNSGSCGVKPRSVLEALQSGWQALNQNPTILTFLDTGIWESARQSASELFAVPAEELMLTQNSTYGIQLVMQSLLLKPGDELLTTNQEHSCVAALSRYLEASRGIVVKKQMVDPYMGSREFCRGFLDLLSSRTRLVLVSEINCLTGWRPNLDSLVKELDLRDVPLLVDGAHSPGQGPTRINDYPFWVASAHKWMGAPNGNGFLRVQPQYMDRLQPLTIADRFFNESFGKMHRFEWPGTCDPVRLLGMHAALKLQLQLGPLKIAAKQKQLHKYLRDAFAAEFPNAKVRTPWVEGETSALFSVYFEKDQLRVDDLKDALWRNHQIWTQPDFACEQPGLGMRISCNVFNTEAELDALVSALRNYLV